MKFLLQLLVAFAFISTSYAQKLKWTHTSPAPPAGVTLGEVELESLRSDAAGNMAYVANASNAGNTVGAFVVWVSSTGKTYHSFCPENSDFAEVVYVNGSTLIVLVRLESGGAILRKFTRKGATVTHVDTDLGQGTYLMREPSPAKAFFFVVRQTGNAITIRRFNK